MSLETSKNLGGIGAIFMLIGDLPFISTYTFGVLGFIGLILVLYALYRFSQIYNEGGIFKNAIYGFVTAIVGAVVAGIIVVFAVLTSLTSLENFILQFYPTWTPGDWSSLSGMTPVTPSNVDFSLITGLIVAVVVVFLIVIIFAVIAAFFVRRSLKQLSVKSAVGLFSTAGLLLLIGAFLLILLIIPGLIVMWIALLLLAIAFFQIKPHVEQQPMYTTAAPPPTPV